LVGFFYNYKLKNEGLEKKILQAEHVNQNINVNINKLLNRIKIKKQNENKQKAIFFCFGILLISLMGIFITIIR